MKKYILGAVLSLGILITPAASYAAGLTSVQISSILSLLSAFGADNATIANVTTALNGGTPSSTTHSFCHTWNTDLTVGSTGEDVLALNQALAASGIDTAGNTSVFNENTAGDVVSFQSHYGIRQTGYVGPMTRTKLNALYACSSPTPTPTPTPSPTPYTPTITSTTAKAAGNFEVDAGGQVSIFGSYLSGNTISTTKVMIGGIAAVVTYASDTVVNANVPSSLSAGQSYPLYISNEKGTSNVVTVRVLSVLGSSTPIAAPVINSTSAKAADTLQMDAGGTASISGMNLASDGLDGTTPSVYLGGIQVSVTYVSSTQLWINVPSSLMPGQSYPLYVVTNHGTSNTLMIKILSNLSSLLLYAKDPNPTTGAVVLVWQTANPVNVALDMVCGSGPISFSTDKNNSPACSKGGVWTWSGQSTGSITLTPNGNTKPVTVTFTATVLDANGTYTSQKQQVNVTFPTSVPTISSFSVNGYSEVINGKVNVYNVTNPTVQWSSTGAAYCISTSVDGITQKSTSDFSGKQSASGSQQLMFGNSYYNQREITLTCFNEAGTRSATVDAWIGGKG
jgi:peptidoglycan hydrolase-like protein with peptidoglycan-binding domain